MRTLPLHKPNALATLFELVVSIAAQESGGKRYVNTALFVSDRE
jgi:hypothetical protein